MNTTETKTTTTIPTAEPGLFVIIGLDTQDGAEHPRYDERVKLAIDEKKVENVMEYGILTPITVFNNGGKLEVMLGRQRVRNAREANKRFEAMSPAQRKKWTAEHPTSPSKVLVPYVVAGGEGAQAYGAMIAENEARRKDNVMVAARKMETFISVCAGELLDLQKDLDVDKAYDLAVKRAATTFACSPAKVKQYQQLLDLAPEVQAKVESGELAVYEVLGLRGLSPEEQAEAATKKATAKKSGKKEKIEGDESRTLRVSKKDIRAVAQQLGGAAQMALLWSIGEIDEAAACEDKAFAKALSASRAK